MAGVCLKQSLGHCQTVKSRDFLLISSSPFFAFCLVFHFLFLCVGFEDVCTLGGACVPCIYTYARQLDSESPDANQVFVIMFM